MPGISDEVRIPTSSNIFSEPTGVNPTCGRRVCVFCVKEFPLWSPELFHISSYVLLVTAPFKTGVCVHGYAGECMFVCACVPHPCGGQSSTFRSLFSLYNKSSGD